MSLFFRIRSIEVQICGLLFTVQKKIKSFFHLLWDIIVVIVTVIVTVTATVTVIVATITFFLWDGIRFWLKNSIDVDDARPNTVQVISQKPLAP